MHSKSDEVEIMINDEVYEVIEELFNSLKNRYHNNLELMKGSEFVFNYIYLLYYKGYKRNPNHGGLYILDSPHWIKNKKVTINPINKKNNTYFQYAVIVMLHHEEIKKDPHRTTKIKLFINKHNWEGIKFTLKKDD